MIADSKKRTTISSSLRMLFLVLIAFTIAVPYIWMILSSFREGQDIFVKGS